MGGLLGALTCRRIIIDKINFFVDILIYNAILNILCSFFHGNYLAKKIKYKIDICDSYNANNIGLKIVFYSIFGGN